jgi:hypothetical protein
MFRLATALVLLLAAAAALLTIERNTTIGQGWVPLAAADEAAACTVTVSPGAGTPIQSAVNAAATNATICVRGGVYQEVIRVVSNRAGIKLVNYPGEVPIIDGNKRLPTTNYGALVKIEASNFTFEGFEVRNSARRGVVVGVKDVAISNIIVRNNKIHDNWETGLLIEGTEEANGSIRWVSNVTVENNQVYRNVRKAKNDPIVYKATKSGSSWVFNPDANWDAPYWSGTGLDWGESTINGLHITPGSDGKPAKIYVTAPGRSRPSMISDAWSATGASFAYEGRDILMYNTSTRKWTTYFDGSARNLGTAKTNIDAIYIEPNAAGCSGCNPIWMSFAASTAVPGAGTADPGDIVKFTPTASPDAQGRLGAGTFTMFRTAASLGLGSGNIDALDRHPDGRIVLSTTGGFSGGGKDDLFIQNGSAWTKYFDGGDTPLNPFFTDTMSVWLDGSGNVHLGGNSLGGSALVFIETKDSVARRNSVYENWGEGMVAGRKSERITLEDNKVWDHSHNSIGLNTTQSPLVQRNLVFCTNNRSFWGKQGNTTSYRPGLGIDLTDEDFSSTRAAASQNQVVINNIVIGCSINFSVASQIAGGGLNNALIANNSFIEARGEAGARINNVNFDATAAYNNSRFVNNLIWQSTAAGTLVARRSGGTLSLSNFVISDNLYSRAPGTKDWWSASDEPGRIVADPLLVNPVLPTSGTVDPGWYALRSGSSPAINAGLAVSQVTTDFFRLTRSGGPDIGADEYNATAAMNGTVIVEVVAEGASGPLDFSFSGDLGGFNLGSSTTISTTLSEQAPGTYTLTQEPTAGWTLDSITCTSDDIFDATVIENGTAAIDLDEGETIACTFTNRPEGSTRTGTIIVVKQTEPDFDPTPFTFTASWDQDGFTLADGQSTGPIVLPVGPYSVSDSQPSGWLETTAECVGDDDGSDPSAIMLDKDEVITCTFFSQYAPNAGSVVFEKRTDPAGDPTAFEFNASWSPTSFSLADGDSIGPVLLSPGTYAISEVVPAGWLQTGATCEGDDDGDDPASIVLEVGETVFCTFSNALEDVGPTTGTITVRKVTSPADDPTVFTFNASWTGTPIDLAGGQSSEAAALEPGTYSVSEDVPAGWTQTGATCEGDDDGTDPSAIVLDAGETIVCTFTNAAVPGRIITTLQTDPAAGGPFSFDPSWSDSDFSLSDDGSNDSGDLAPGAYSLAEVSAPEGWAQTGAACEGGAAASTPTAIVLGPGETITCTLTYTLGQGAIVVRKQVNDSADQTALSFSGSWGANFVLGDTTEYNSGALAQGTYSVSVGALPAGWTQTGASCDDGSPVTAIAVRAGQTTTCTFAFVKPLPPSEMFTISPASAGTMTGIGDYGTSDILTYQRSGAWARPFTGETLGLTKNVKALERMPDGSYLLALFRNQTVPGPGTVTPQDVIRYIPAAGGNPARYELYLDGSRFYLTTSGEAIDALALAPDGRLLLSITGAGSVNPASTLFKPQNEDLFAWDKTTGLFAPYFVGKGITGMGAENLVNASVAANGDIYAGFADNFTIGGLTGNAKSVVQFQKTGTGLSSYTVVKPAYLNWATTGFPGAADAFDIDLAP